MQLDVTRIWYRKSLPVWLFVLIPFSYLFALIIFIRKKLYRTGFLKAVRVSAPVIIVGNITVGGTGKTPFVIWLANYLKQQGYQPGIVTRGVGGKKQVTPHLVMNDHVHAIGDEAMLISQHVDCPIMLCVDRARAAQLLIKQHQCNIIISDDGLQHYGLARDIEIVIIDAARQFGNGYLIPAGPLREPVSRLQTVDFVLQNGAAANAHYVMTLANLDLVAVKSKSSIALAGFPRGTIHAVAGIGNPERFFHVLQQAGFTVIKHIFPDHHVYQKSELEFSDSYPILMTEKDAVKCQLFADDRYWYLPVEAQLNPEFLTDFSAKLKLLKETCHDTETDFTKSPCRLNDTGSTHRVSRDD